MTALAAAMFANACSHKLESAQPATGLAEPQIVCNEQLTKTLVLAGERFSPTVFDALTDGKKVILPAIFLTREKDERGAAVQGTRIQIPDDPAAPAASRVRWQSQSRMTFEVFPELQLAPGVYSITVRNASGLESVAPNALAVVPRPTVTQIVPDIACTEQFDVMVTVRGRDFVRLGDTLPRVAIGPSVYTPAEALECEVIPGPVSSAQRCQSLRVRIPRGELDNVAAGTTRPLDVVVTNPVPAECHSTDTKRFTSFPRPRLASIAADLVCTEQYANTMTLTGQDFLVVNAIMPTVQIGDRTYTPTAPAGTCETLAGFDEPVRRCTVLEVVVAQGQLGPGLHSVEVTNPPPESLRCKSTEPVDLLVVPRPVVTDVEPDLVCREQLTNEVTIRGSGFLSFAGASPAVPSVTIGSQSFSGASVRALGCTHTLGRAEMASACSTLVVTVPAGTLAAGPNAVTVQNPAPAQCVSTDAFNLVAIDRPAISSVTRPALCLAQGQQALGIHGSGFLRVGAQVPVVTLAGTTTRAYTPTLSGCIAIAGAAAAELCTDLTITLPINDLPVGAYTLSVRNPAPAACETTDSVAIQITAPPSVNGVAVSGVSTPRICESGGSVIVMGAGFQDGAVATLSHPSNGVTQDAFLNAVTDNGATLNATFGPGLRAIIPPPRYTLTVRNPDGCSASRADAVDVTRGIFTFFVDPPVVYNGINTKITILGSGITAQPTEVRLVNAATGTTLTFTGSAIEWSASQPQRVRVTIARDVPVGTTPAGTYSVGISDGAGCLSFLRDGFVISDQTKLALLAISPPFGGRAQNTPVTITAKATAALGAGEVNFRAIPRVYLSPVADTSAPATEVRAVSFVNEARVTGIAPNVAAALTVGAYNVIAVNPTGEVGVLPSAYRVTQEPPPLVDSVSPGTLRTNESAAPILVSGASFRTASVRLTCRVFGGTSDTVVEADAEAVSAGGTRIDATVNTSTLSNGMVCVVRVTNTDDGTFFDFSAVTIANPAQGTNPLNFLAGTPMTTARRATAGVAARATRTARFVYAIGGDSGVASGALGSVEAAPVGLFGDLGEWFRLPIDLTEGNPASGAGATIAAKRTLSHAVLVGRFLFLVGGHDGTNVTAKVLRAQVLDPADAPVMGDPDLVVDTDDEGGASGLPGGVWTYRVSALLASSEGHNPGGETLPSDPLVIRVPTVEFPVSLRVCWVPPPGVSVAKHRVYRTRVSNEPAGQERLLAECPGAAGCSASLPCYDDTTADEAGFLDSARGPLPLGSTGVWHEVSPLLGPRASAGVAAVALNDGARASVFAVGGTGNLSTGLATYEHLVVNANGTLPGGAAWQSGAANTLGSARHELQLFVATRENATRVGSDAWVYAGGGKGDLRAVSVAKVDQTSGNLGAWIEDGTRLDFQGDRAGYASAVGNNFLYVVGGSGGAPDASGDKAEICGGTRACAGGPTDPPDLVNWNNTGVGSMRPRYLLGSAIQSSFWYLLGGVGLDPATGNPAVTNSTDLSVLGGQP
jgi:hypothetical protein